MVINPPGHSRSPTGSTISPGSAGRCCARCPASRHRLLAPAPGDLGLQVLEWWAYLGDILTFYNERIANEGYLRTATRRTASLTWWRCWATAGPASPPPGSSPCCGGGAPREPLVVPAGSRCPASRLRASRRRPSRPRRRELHRPVERPGHARRPRPCSGSTPTAAAVCPARRPGQRHQPRATGSCWPAPASLGWTTTGRSSPWTRRARGRPGNRRVNTWSRSPPARGGRGAATPLVRPATRYRLLRPTAAAALWNRGAPTRRRGGRSAQTGAAPHRAAVGGGPRDLTG